MTVPHAGEEIPKNVHWLQELSEPHLMRDVDRYVDKIYEPTAQKLKIPFIKTQWHRYVVDLNRFPGDFDAQAVEGASHPQGTHPKGLHWSVTTHGEPLIEKPMSRDLHLTLLKNYYEPFHQKVEEFRSKNRPLLHLDCHSMPSLGTELHADPGQHRPDIVISDYHGKTCNPALRDMVLTAYQDVGFEVAYNYPYVGGGVTRMYGNPKEGFHNIQIELNRKLYMNEETKKRVPKVFTESQERIAKAIEILMGQLEASGLEV